MPQISLSGQQDPRIWDLGTVRKRIAEGRERGPDKKEIESSIKWQARSLLRQSLSDLLPTEGYLVFGDSDIHIPQPGISPGISECSVPLLHHTQACHSQGVPCVHWQLLND